MMHGGGGTDSRTVAMQSLATICDGFVSDGDWFTPCEVVEPQAMPALARELLVHDEHMTQTLREHYGGELKLEVLDYHQESNVYSRKIRLWSDGGGRRRVVEFGIVRIDLSCATPSAAEEIVSRGAPLGDILRRHGLLTRVRPKWYLRFPANGVIGNFFAEHPVASLGMADGFVYGRLAMIDVNGSPGVELLEVVSAG